MSVYSALLTGKRFRNSGVQGRNIIAEAESDRGRLLFCAAFRRLQQKAQVFSMEPNAAVRSRLTHSLEVSQMGRYIADQIGFSLIEKKLATNDECTALVTFVETACLMHDIGNPPFGHFGEAAIAEWFRDNGAQSLIKACGKKEGEIGKSDPRVVVTLADFISFDGNPQGLRVVAKLQRNSDEYGLNLTKTTLASYLKYVRSSTQSPNEINSPFTKKCGYFTTEASIVQSIREEYKYDKPQRFPLAYIMEAADDIAYCISDLEDSIEKGLLNKQIALSEIRGRWQNLSLSQDQTADEISHILDWAVSGKTHNGLPFTFTDFRTALNRALVRFCTTQYIDNHNRVLNGTLSSLIPPESPSGRILDLLKEYCREKVYGHESVQRTELAGYTAIYGLLNHFRCLFECRADRFLDALDSKNKDGRDKPIVVEKKFLSLYPKNYVRIYREELAKADSKSSDFCFTEWNLRTHLITDYISGMTDDFAMTTYRTLSGMRL